MTAAHVSDSIELEPLVDERRRGARAKSLRR